MIIWGEKGPKSNTYLTGRIDLRSPAESLVQAGTGVTSLSNGVSFRRGIEAFDKMSGEW